MPILENTIGKSNLNTAMMAKIITNRIRRFSNHVRSKHMIDSCRIGHARSAGRPLRVYANIMDIDVTYREIGSETTYGACQLLANAIRVARA